ncbi:uncharacterized protein TRIADDRAFT_60391 [Trichoplax adhaerens]|uniref:Glycosyltransferase 61 catalytic domain-containing protein n=1 Tax=Trichoplax adhaerens TaxID=10228 RepID=B3S835_TRIAD|nr:predicted protein [Trichoplax adhaerens]EDV21035.1 predicted protein [Trichoplax adhaerens]|eukprot:XP_002116365.1 predicted protein [Trichoplax adhaerens]
MALLMTMNDIMNDTSGKGQYLVVSAQPGDARRTSQHPWSYKSKINCSPGHYPPDYCTLTKAYFHHSDRIFYLNTTHSIPNPAWSTQLWTTKTVNIKSDIQCHHLYHKAFIFTFFFYYGHSNNFHLHYDTLIPIYSQLRFIESSNQLPLSNQSIVLMPTVEKKRMEILDWDTDAFTSTYKDSYFMEALKVLTGPHAFLPMSKASFNQYPNAKTCFEEAKLGTPRVEFTDKKLIRGYISFILRRLRIKKTTPKAARIALIKRTNRRLILNQDELINSVKSLANIELVDFNGMTFKQQVKLMRKYSVLIGMNGAGLMNGLFLPKGAVNIQLVPYKAQLNFKEFGSLLSVRGPYLEWHNQHEHLNHDVPGDNYHGQADTIVKVDEFVELIKKALNTGLNAKLQKRVKTEL